MKKLFNSTDESIESRLKAFPAEVTELALKSMRDEIFIFMDKVNRENLKILEFRTSDYKSYAELKKLENIFIQYNHRLLAQSLSEEQLVEIDRLLTAVRHSIYSAKSLKDIIDDFDDYLVKEMLLDELNNNLLRQAKHYLESTIKLMAEEPESIDNIYLETWHQALTESLNRTHAKITHHLQISDEMSLDVRSTLLNINKEIFTSCKYSQRALQAFIKAE